MMSAKRLYGLDVFRGWAIILMIVFHFFYNMQYFEVLDIDLKEDMFWVLFRVLIVSIFLFSVGISLQLVHETTIKWVDVKKRLLTLGGASLLVSVATYVQFGNSYIYFGVLHFIFVATFVGLIFLYRPYIAIAVSIMIFIGSATKGLDLHWLYLLLQPLLDLPTYTVDLMRFFPWFGVVLLGISFVSLGHHKQIFESKIFYQGFLHNRFLSFLGRHSLVIYLIHQPILFGLTELYLS